jgi:hypothetical protein
LLSRHGFHDFELEENGSGKLSVSLATLGIRFMWSLREVANSLVLGKVTGQVATVGLYTYGNHLHPRSELAKGSPWPSSDLWRHPLCDRQSGDKRGRRGAGMDPWSPQGCQLTLAGEIRPWARVLNAPFSWWACLIS